MHPFFSSYYCLTHIHLTIGSHNGQDHVVVKICGGLIVVVLFTTAAKTPWPKPFSSKHYETLQSYP